MKWLIVILAIFLLTLPSVAQEDSCKIETVKKVNPIYPEEAKKEGVEGTVYVGITINKEGLVETAMVTKTDDERLNIAALNAVIQWKFKPLTKICKVTIPVKFKLAQ